MLLNRSTTARLQFLNETGFTVLEMMMVIAVLGVLIAIAAPSFSSVIEKQRAKSAAADLHTALTLARSEAIKRNRDIMLSAKSGDWKNGWQITDSDSDTVLDDHPAVTGISFASSATSIVYRSSGRISGAANVTIGITGSYTTSARCIYLDLSGRPTIKGEACSAS